MINNLREAQKQLIAGADDYTVLRQAKLSGAFSGPLRNNLVEILNYVGVHKWQGLQWHT
jgi:hypothetical protein